MAGDLSVAFARDSGVFLADPNFHLRHLFHGLGELLFHLAAVELASDLTVLYDPGEAPFHLDAVELTVALARDSGVFLVDPDFHLRHLFHGLGELLFHLDSRVFLVDPDFHLRHLFHGLGEVLFHLDAVELASDLTVLYDLGEAPFHLDFVELTRDSYPFLYAWIQSHLDAIQ